MMRGLAGLALLTAAIGAIAAPPAEDVERAGLLAYRQWLDPAGDRLAATAAILRERALRADDVDLAAIREQVAARLEGAVAAASAPASGPPDAVAAHFAQARGRAAGDADTRLLPAWRMMEARGDLDGLSSALAARASRDAGDIWMAVLAAMRSDPDLAAVLEPMVAELAGAPADGSLASWRGVPPALPASALRALPQAQWRQALATRVAGALEDPADVSPEEAARWRVRGWIQHRQGAAPDGRQAMDRLQLALLDTAAGFGEGNPLPFMTVLLEGVLELALVGELSDGVRTDLRELGDELDDLPMRHDAQWREVDARLPELFAEILDRLGQLVSDEGDPPLRALAALEANLSQLDGDWEAYLSQPFREPVQQAISNCFVGGDVDSAACRERFRDWALEGATIPEASGDIKGPFDPEYLLREMELNPWQRINYLRGYWRDLMGRDCSGANGIGNVLEWSLGARAYLALLEDVPPADREQVASDLDALIQAGAVAVTELDRQASCQARGEATLMRVFGNYEAALADTARALPVAAAAFREQLLLEGSDVTLDDGADQTTRYVPQAIRMAPCEGVASCGVSQPLAGSGELFLRFPAPFRIAHQAGLGTVSLCYADVSWVDRRLQPSRVGGEVMAEYLGHLGFRVRGRYSEGGEVRDVFSLRMVSEREYAYLYGPNRPEVLADPCPQEYVGVQTAGSLPEGRGWLVPRRLTFLSAERTTPDRLFTEHWERGENWLERLSAGRDVTVEKAAEDPAELRARVDLHLASLRERRRHHLFERMISAGPDAAARDPEDRRLSEAAGRLAATRQALDASTRVFLPRSFALDRDLRQGLYGAERLAGPRLVRQWRDAGNDPLELPSEARDRVARHRPVWAGASGRSELPDFLAVPLLDLLLARERFESAVTSGDGASGQPPSL